MRIKGQELKNLMNGTIGILITNARDAYISLLQSIRKDQALIIARIQNYEYRHEQSAYRPVQFCRFIKTVHFPQIQEKNLTQHCLLSVTQEINMEDLIKIMDGDIHLLERWIGNVLLLTPMSSPVLLKSLSVTDVWWCVHISCVTPNRVWVSDWNNVSLIDTSTGKTIYRLNNSAVLESGIHTVNSDSELIYIDNLYNICKVAADMKTTTLLKGESDPEWTPLCVYCSPSSGDLLVGMNRFDTLTDMVIGKVMRYNEASTIPQNNTPDKLYQHPLFITENNNGDVVVSDSQRRAVVVTLRKGDHRFSYKGPLPSGPQLEPSGVCTDVMSNILVCDARTVTVQMLSRDGDFLKYFLTKESPGIDYSPYCLSYDFYTHSLWVGSGTWTSVNKMFLYRYINRHPAILGRPQLYHTHLLQKNYS